LHFTYIFWGKINIFKTTFDFAHLIKGTVLGQALWGANTFPTHNRFTSSSVVRRPFFILFLVFHSFP